MKSLMAAVLAVVVIGAGAYPQEMSANEQLFDFAAFAAGEQLEITGWTITIKEPLNIEQVESVKENLSAFLNKADHDVEHNANANTFKWKNSHKSEGFVEYFNLIVPDNEETQAEMVYSIEGWGTVFLSQEITEKMNRIKSRFFSKNVTIFSCLKASSNGIMNDVLVYENFKKKYNVATINQVTENGWTSRSGYSKQWSQSLPLLNEVMNVQFASRTLGGRTNITIGTPIITAEY